MDDNLSSLAFSLILRIWILFICNILHSFGYLWFLLFGNNDNCKPTYNSHGPYSMSTFFFFLSVILFCEMSFFCYRFSTEKIWYIDQMLKVLSEVCIIVLVSYLLVF